MMARACLEGAVRSRDDLINLLNDNDAPSRAPAKPAPIEAVALA
jgi:hypothetical protein